MGDPVDDLSSEKINEPRHGTSKRIAITYEPVAGMDSRQKGR